MPSDCNLYTRFQRGFIAAAPCVAIPGGPRYTYGELERQAARAANTLRTLGLGPGDCVAAIAEKSASLLWLYLGCLRAGCIYQPLNPAYSERELRFFLQDSAARMVVYDPALAARLEAVAPDCPALALRLSLDATGVGEMSDRCAGAGDEFTTEPVAGSDVAALLYSSGTTGTPKGIPLTHDNLHANAAALAHAWGFTRDDVLLHALPLYHVHGLFITLGPALLSGASLRLLPRFEVAAVSAALPGASVMAGVPTYYTRLLAEPRFGRDSCAGMRLFISGSAPLQTSTFHEFTARTGHTILERYGMTETGINTSNPLAGVRKAGAVGPPLEGVEVRVVDDRGQAVARGCIGQIEVRGPNVFGGYWRLPEHTATAFSDDGYFRTGDQGSFDEDGYLSIVGRSKDMIISGGLNVYPKEIENELDELPGVAESAVFGVPHADFGEAVIAAVITRDAAGLDEATVIAHLRTRLAGYKLPKRVVVVDALPRNTMGKVQKNRLREDFAGIFAHADGAG